MKVEKIHIAVGNLNVDVTMYVSRLPGPDEAVIADDLIIGPGGSASNYAVAVAAYGHTAYLVASTSTDPLAEGVLSILEEKGVKTLYVKRIESPPGLVSVYVIPGGERLMVKFRGANELLSPNDVPRSLLEKASIVHIASIPPSIALEIADRASDLGLMVSYDPGAYALKNPDSVLKVLKNVTILFLNRKEAKAISIHDPRNLLEHGPLMIVVKKGPAGAYVVTHGDKYYSGVSRPIRPPVDSTGAGDAFDAFFNAAYLDYKDPGKALMYALAAGALKVTCKGSQICWNKQLFNRQLGETSIEALKKPPEWLLED